MMPLRAVVILLWGIIGSLLTDGPVEAQSGIEEALRIYEAHDQRINDQQPSGALVAIDGYLARQSPSQSVKGRPRLLSNKSVSIKRPERAIEDIIITAAHTHGISPALVTAVVNVESNFRPMAISPKGALGLMQLMPDTARELGVRRPFDPWENIHGGTAYLSSLIKDSNGDLRLALAAYNAGPSKVGSWKKIPETRSYVRAVIARYSEYERQRTSE